MLDLPCSAIREPVGAGGTSWKYHWNMIGTRACAGLICSLWAFGLSHAVYGQVTSESEPAPQSADMRVSPKYLPASADMQAQTKVAGAPFEWSASDKRLIVKPALLVLPDGVDRSFQVKLSAVPSGDVTVELRVPTRLDGKLLLSAASLTFTASNYDTFQKVIVAATPGSDTEDKEESLTLEASGGGYDSVEASVPVYVDQDDCGSRLGYWQSVSEGTSCVATFQCGLPGLDVGDYAFVFHVNGSATPGVDLILNGLDSLEVIRTTFINSGWTGFHSYQLIAPAEGIPEGDETLSCFCIKEKNPPGSHFVGDVILILDADGWAVGDTVAAESSGEMTFLLKFPKPVARDLTVKYQTEDGSATDGDDYDSRTGEVTVQVGDTSAEIRVPLIPDNIAEGEEEFKLLTWSDQFRGIGTLKSTGKILEASPGIQLRMNPLEVEEGSSATYQARLATEPSDEVMVAISGYSGTDVRLEQTTSLTFMPSDFGWKEVKVSTDIDADADPDKVTLTHTASGASEYAGVTADLEVTILDRYVIELKVAPTVLALKEKGSDPEKEQDFTVRLGSPPVGGEVKVAISVANALQNKVSLSESGPLTFDTSSWDEAQTVTVTALADADAEDESGTVDLTASGADYTGQSESVTVAISDDDDTPGLTITPPAITVVEGERETYGVALVTEPESVVTVTIGSSNTDVKPTPASLEFSAVNWGIEQQVTVSAARDSDGNDETATLTHTASGADYGGVTKNLVVTVIDPDVSAGLVVSPRSLTVTEGTEGRFGVKLLTRPTQTVTVQVTGDDGSGLRVDPRMLRFTTDDWDTAVQIVVEAEQDDDGIDARVRLTLTASGAEYTGQEETVVVEIEDDDVARIVVVPQELAIDEGGDKSYEVSLSTAPSAAVTVEIASDNPNVGMDREVLTFAVNDWDEAQEVTVHAFEDDDAVDDFATLPHTASGGDYEGLTTYVSVEVTDNDEVELRVSPQSLRLVEGASGKAFDVWLGAVPSGEVKVSVTESSTLLAKVSVSPSSLTFSPSTWESPQPVMVTARDDEDESEESGEVRLEASGGGYNGKSVEVQIGIRDDDVRYHVELIRPEVLVTEGAGPARFEVRLDRESDAEVRVHYTTRSGTAKEGMDYEHASNTLTFAPGGGLVQWIDVPIVDDRVHEEEESFRLVLSNAEGAELGTSIGTVTILDNDLAPTFRTVPAVYVREGGVAKVHVRLSNASSQPVTASYRTSDVTATGDKDYQAEVAGAITIGAGELEAVIAVPTLDDLEHEGREAFVVQLDGGGRIVVTILDNDSIPGLSVEDVTVSEDGERAKVAVLLDGASAVRVGVAYATHDGTATAEVDYTRAMGTLVFAPGEVKREVLIAVQQDEFVEEDETFRFRLSAPEHAQLLDGEAIVTIVDDPLEVSIYDGTGTESAEELVLPVRLNYSSNQVVSAQFAVTGGTATPDVDFESTQGVVVFEPGSVEAQVRIPLKDDDLMEGDETVEVTLSDPRNAVLGQAQATGTITDDETVPGVRVRALTPTAREAVFVITAAVGQVRYRTMDGTAWEGEDYERTEGMLEFGTGGSEKEVRVPLLSGQGRGEMFALMVEVEGEAIRAEVVLGGRSDRRGRALLGRSMAQHVVEAVSERLQGGVAPCMPRPYPGQVVRASHILSGCGMQASGERVSVWGRGAYSRLRGSEVQGMEIMTASLGADYTLGSRWLMGVMVSRSEARESSLQLTGWYPYVRYGGQEHQVWGLAGAGQGEGTGMRLMAAGVAGRLARTRGMRLGYEADGFWLGMDREIGVRRLRAGLEGSVVLGEVLEPYVEAALLHSAGDAERGLGMEAGGGMRVRMGMMQAEVMSRRVVVQAEEGAGEWGYAGMLRYGGLEGMGVQVRPSWGRTHVGSLWQSERPWEVYGSDGRMDVELGYGAQLGGRSVLRPHVGVVLRERGRDYRIGAGVQGRRGIGFSMSGMAMEHMAPYQPVHYGVTASGYVRW